MRVLHFSDVHVGMPLGQVPLHRWIGKRALGVLRSARLLGTEEAMKLLSRVRLGMCLGQLDGIDLDAINQLFLLIQPAHLQFHSSGALSADQLRVARASLVREALGGGSD